MRRALSLPVVAVMAALIGAAPTISFAMSGQQSQRQRPGGGQQQADGQDAESGSSRAPRFAPLSQRVNAGPCPYVKVLYDAARYVELADNRAALANVGYTGEIQGVSAGCSYRGDEPITVQMDTLFTLGRGPQASASQRTYRYWIAVTARNEAVLAKEYFDLPVNFDSGRTASVNQQQTIVIPRANTQVSGGNFEILVGFDVTPEMAQFNREGSRFRVNAGTTPAAPAAQPPAQ